MMLFLLVGSLFLLHGMKHFWNESLGLCSMDNALWKVMQHQISLFKSHAERDVDVPGVGEECGNSEMLQVLVWIVVKHRRSLQHWHGSGDVRGKKERLWHTGSLPFQKLPPLTPLP